MRYNKTNFRMISMSFFPLDDYVHFPSFSSNVSRVDGIDVYGLLPGPSVHGNISTGLSAFMKINVRGNLSPLVFVKLLF
jgi:hypothetical protein